MTKENKRKRQSVVSLDIPVEELAQQYPSAVGFLTRHNIRCIRCGEPLWCTLGELLKDEGVSNPQQLLDVLNNLLTGSDRMG